jgi:chromosome segregation ATPase
MDKIKSFIKSKIKIVVIVSTVILLLLATLSSFLGISLFQTNNELNNTKTILSERKNELMITSRELDETKDQKLALETENADLINQINDLNANRAQLESDIASKQTELEQANVALQGTKRCVALFDNVRGQLNSYNANLEKSGALVLEAI